MDYIKLKEAHGTLKSITASSSWNFLKEIIENPGQEQSELAKTFGCNQSLVSQSTRQAKIHGIIKQKKNGHKRQHFINKERFEQLANAINNFVKL